MSMDVPLLLIILSPAYRTYLDPIFSCEWETYCISRNYPNKSYGIHENNSRLCVLGSWIVPGRSDTNHHPLVFLNVPQQSPTHPKTLVWVEQQTTPTSKLKSISYYKPFVFWCPILVIHFWIYLPPARTKINSSPILVTTPFLVIRFFTQLLILPLVLQQVPIFSEWL